MITSPLLSSIQMNKRVPERAWGRRVIRYLVAHHPRWAMRVLPLWRLWRQWTNQWSLDWRFLVQDMTKKQSSPPNIELLWALGPLPLDWGRHDQACVRMPIWYVLATQGTPEMLSWAQDIGVAMDERLPNRSGFLGAALDADNMPALCWGLTQAHLSADDVCYNGQPLLCRAIDKSSVEHPELVSLLLSHGASWYYQGLTGDSANSYAPPQWTAWLDKQCLHATLLTDAPPALTRPAPRRRM